jgi:uncharacterized Fe-S cluster-containing MiaB family protein
VQSYAESILGNETFLLIEEVEAIIFTTMEIKMGIVGSWNFYDQKESQKSLRIKIIKRFQDTKTIELVVVYSTFEITCWNRIVNLSMLISELFKNCS